MPGSHLDHRKQAALTAVTAWEGTLFSPPTLVCYRTEGVTACDPSESVPLLSALLCAQVVGHQSRGAIPSPL